MADRIHNQEHQPHVPSLDFSKLQHTRIPPSPRGTNITITPRRGSLLTSDKVQIIQLQVGEISKKLVEKEKNIQALKKKLRKQEEINIKLQKTQEKISAKINEGPILCKTALCFLGFFAKIAPCCLSETYERERSRKEASLKAKKPVTPKKKKTRIHRNSP